MPTLSQAVSLVRQLQPLSMHNGYYLALAGGVLNKGVSANDIDLVAVPRDRASKPEALINYLSKELTLLRDPSKNVRGRDIDVYHYQTANIKIDLAVILQRGL